MQAPTLDKSQADRPSNGPARSRRRLTSLLVAATLAVLGGAAGVTVALANRPEPAAPAAQPAATTVAPAAAATPTAGQPAKAAPAAPATAGQPVILPDGRHDAFVRKVDSGRGTIVLDVVQVFHDEEAVKAAIADGKPRADAQYLQAYVRNQNPRLRTLPLASGVRVNLLGGCEEPKGDQQALAKLASNARLGNVYYYTVTVKGGAVRQLDEHLAVNAC
jgi:pyruvate/2-oxoglutarate dehydrogenase complex dihydrolipoamide acyltransferase (E2) component